MKSATRKRKATRIRRKASKASAAQFLQQNAGSALRRGRDTINRAYDWAHDTGKSAHLGSMRMPRRSDIAHLTEANPLLLGAVGLGLGVAIGTLFPRGMSRMASGRSTAAGNGPTRPVKSASRRRRKARKSAAAAN